MSKIKSEHITTDLTEIKELQGNTTNNCMPKSQTTQMKWINSYKVTNYRN